MKLHTISAVLAAPLFLVGPMVQDGGQGDLSALVAEQGQKLSELRIELTETQDRLEMTLTYLQQQAEAAKALEGSLSQVEALGFTAGINPRSRETLLTGWRGYLAGQQTGVPKGKQQPVLPVE